MKKFLILILISISASVGFANDERFGEGQYTTQGVGQCYPGYMGCYEDYSNRLPAPESTTWSECLSRVKNGDPYRWLNKFNKCLGSDGRFAG